MRQAVVVLTLLGCSEVALNEQEYAPIVTIRSPSDASVVAQGAPLAFVAQVETEDLDTALADLIVTFRSDLDGDLTPEAATVGPDTVSFTRTDPLSIGLHELTVTAKAPNGTAPGKDRVRFTVVEDTAPSVSFSSPADGVYVAFDAALTVEAHVADAEQPAAELTLAWGLDAQPVAGALAHADDAGVARHTFGGLALGRRTVTVTATDDAGVSTTADLHLHAVEPDADGDGAVTARLGGPDCDDQDATVFPGADEVCNDRDDDCDTFVDDDDGDLDPASATAWHPDADLDTYGDALTVVVACVAPAGWLEDGRDCADDDPSRRPGEEERCNGVDDDCDGVIPADEVDADGDGIASCDGDCDDTDPLANPGEREVCDAVGRDADCDGLEDEADPTLDPASLSSFWPDADADGHGDLLASPTLACDAPPGWVATATDCDDGAALVHPGALEVCNDLVDDDCDTLRDDADPDLALASADTFHRDLDGDGYGDPAVTTVACVGLAPLWIEDGTDCDDALDEVHPGAAEICNGGIDDDCDTLADDDDPDVTGGDPWYADVDGDTFGDDATVDVFCAPPGGRVDRGADCDDADMAVNPTATEVCNAADDDCDMLVDDDDPSLFDPTAASGSFDADADAWGAWRDMVCDTGRLATEGPEQDCNDANAEIHPYQVEDCTNGIDDDCSGDAVACRYSGEKVVETEVLVGPPAAVIRGDDGSRLGGAIDVAVDAVGETVLLVGATGHGGSDRGAAFVFVGPMIPGAEVDLADADVALGGLEAQAELGHAVALGDLDDDGVLDFVVAAPDADDAGGAETGAVFLFAGADATAGEWTTADATATFYGDDANDIAGTAVLVGDLTCDGVDDLVVTAPGTADASRGTVYVFFGPVTRTGTVVLSDANLVILGDENGDRIGDAVDLGGDPSGTAPGCPGLFVGAARWGVGSNNRGAAYLFAADDPAFHGLDATASQATITAGTAWAVFRGIETGHAGSAVAFLGDIDQSGGFDYAIGAPTYNDPATPSDNEGHAYLVLDPDAGEQDLDGPLAQANIVTLRNMEMNGAAGTAMAAVGDLDADGWDELVITAVDHDGLGLANTGGAYLRYGDGVEAFASGTLQASFDAGFLGMPNDHLGDAVHGVPDIDRDGIDDLAVTVSLDDEGLAGSDHGAVYILFGTGG